MMLCFFVFILVLMGICIIGRCLVWNSVILSGRLVFLVSIVV